MQDVVVAVVVIILENVMCSYFRRYTTSLLKLTFARRKC
jgi:hypothetical protein